MIFSSYKKAFEILMKKPLQLWGISLLGGLLTALACFLGVLPIIVIPIVLVLGFGMTAVFYRGFHGEEVNADLLFSGFKDFVKTACSMGWRALWLFIWSPVPVMNVIKLYSYSFVPYLLITRPALSGTDALRVSMAETKGYRWKLFGADIIAALAVGAASGILALLAQIPYIGVLFSIILVLFTILLGLVYPLFIGLVQACMFDAVQEARETEANRPKNKICPNCGASVPNEARFCANCGFNFAQPPVNSAYQGVQFQTPAYPAQPVYPQQQGGDAGFNQSGEYQPPQQG